MSLDISFMYKDKAIFDCSITHNLGRMATEVGIYKHLWRSEEINITKAGELVEPLKAGLAFMRSDPARFRVYDDDNGWGTYDQFLPWIEALIWACDRYPDADLRVSK